MNEDIRAKEVLSRVRVDNPRGVEVGVFAGTMSEHLLTMRPDLFLYMVDSWLTRDQWPKAYIDCGDYHAQLGWREQKTYWIAARQVEERYASRSQILKMDSADAAATFHDRSLDFVFIDADHSYEGCSRDIEVWRTKIKPGGLLSGHDYNEPDHPRFGVTRAVNEAVKRYGWNLELAQNFTWFVRL